MALHGTDHLRVQCAHQRTTSTDSHNYSVLECYEDTPYGGESADALETNTLAGSFVGVKLPLSASPTPDAAAATSADRSTTDGSELTSTVSSTPPHITTTNTTSGPNVTGATTTGTTTGTSTDSSVTGGTATAAAATGSASVGSAGVGSASVGSASVAGSTKTTVSPADSPAEWTPPELRPVTKLLAAYALRAAHDLYGFKKDLAFLGSSAAAYNDWFARYAAQLPRQKKKWLALMRANGLTLHGAVPPTRFPPRSDRAKRLVRKGVPPEWRGNAWFFYAGGYEKLAAHAGLYDRLVRDTAGLANRDTELVEKDLHRTFPDNIHFKDPARGARVETDAIRALRRVLVAFSQYKPQIGYCQSLNFLAGMLLLFMSEERAFWMLVILTERIIPKVHSDNLEGVHINQGVLMMCIEKYIPELWDKAGRIGDEVIPRNKILTQPTPLAIATSTWFMSLFALSLPIETVLRVWDILWYEGSKTIFRIALTICRLCLDNTAAGGDSDPDQLMHVIQDYPKTLLDPNVLINRCYEKDLANNFGAKRLGLLSQKDVDECRKFVQRQRAEVERKRLAFATDLNDHERLQLQADGIHEEYKLPRLMKWSIRVKETRKRES